MINTNYLEYVLLEGNQIGDEFYNFTNGSSGLMYYWMRQNRASMKAVAVTYAGEIIGWAAFLKEDDIYSLGVFIDREHRGFGLGRMALTLLIEVIKEENAKAICKFGGSMVYQFDWTYSRIVGDAGLMAASIFETNEEIKRVA